MSDPSPNDQIPVTRVGTTSYHMAQSIRGPLANWTAREWRAATKYFTRDDGGRFTVDELKEAFMDELAKGHDVIPIGECDNFDFKKGCLGHRNEG